MPATLARNLSCPRFSNGFSPAQIPALRVVHRELTDPLKRA
jgi:hypothetical protein